MSPAPLEICSQCGIVAPSAHSRCEACGAELAPGARSAAPERPDGRFWVQVRAEFQCKHCEHMSPVNHVDVDGTFTCLRCHFEQAADPTVWGEALRFCHAVGDLAGRGGEGRSSDPEIPIAPENEYADVGVSRSAATFRLAETKTGPSGTRTRNLHVEAAPGVPLCRACSRPLEVELASPGTLRSRCPGCGDGATYEAPPKARELHHQFAGVLASEHRTDCADARMNAPAPGGAIAIECPKCNAPLQLAARDRFVECKFCGTASKVPIRMRSQLFKEGIEKDRWWLLFVGPSPLRGKLVKRARHRVRQEEAKLAKAARRQAPVRPVEAQAPQAPRPQRERGDEPSKLERRLAWAVAPVAVATLAAIHYFTRQPEPAAPPPASTQAPATEVATPVEPARTEPVAAPPRVLAGCGCALQEPGRKQRVDVALAVRLEVTAKMSMGGIARVYSSAEYFLDVEERHLRLAPGPGDAPPVAVEGIALELAVGCDKDVVAIAGPSAATGWSSATGQKVWSTPLPAGRGPVLADAELQVTCRKTVTQGGVMTIPPAPGESVRPVRLRLSDGRLL